MEPMPLEVTETVELVDTGPKSLALQLSPSIRYGHRPPPAQAHAQAQAQAQWDPLDTLPEVDGTGSGLVTVTTSLVMPRMSFTRLLDADLTRST
jgi:hypothetical protein